MSSKSNNRQGWLPKVLLAVVAALIVPVYPGYFLQKTNAQEEKRVRSETGDMECMSYCSTTKPGTVVMEVRWRLADSLLTDTDLRAKALQQRLDVTVYSDGYERGLYVSVAAIKPKAPFRMAARVEGITPRNQPERKPPGLEKLVITDVATRVDKPARSFLLMPPIPGPATDTAGAEWFTVRLEGLDPGMDYTYRVPGGKSQITCQAVVCPLDKVSAPAGRAKRKT